MIVLPIESTEMVVQKIDKDRNKVWCGRAVRLMFTGDAGLLTVNSECVL